MAIFQESSIEQYQKLIDEIGILRSIIDATKSEVAHMHTNNPNTSHITSAQDELDAILECTADATNNILESAEALFNYSERCSDDQKSFLQEHCTRIFEACTFQDLTGQRVTKIVRTLQMVEEAFVRILSGFSQDDVVPVHMEKIETPPQVGELVFDNMDERSLMNGPQIKAPDQDAIDNLFENLIIPTAKIKNST